MKDNTMQGMMTCAELVNRLGALSDGELDAATVSVIEKHLGACHPCARIARSYKDVTEAARMPDPAQIDPQMSEKIIADVLAAIGPDPSCSGNE